VHTHAAGNLQVQQPYFMASTTKLYVTALMLRLRLQGALALDDTLTAHLPPSLLQGIHTYQGHNYTPALTLRHLLAHTSGLPDYFQYKHPDRPSLLQQIARGHDVPWTLETVLENVRHMTPAFAPGTPGRALYSDTNFQLLGRVAETHLGMPLAQAIAHHIAQPLGLTQTYLYTDPADTRPAGLYYQQHPLHIPQAMASFGADGGIVSTAAESLRFVRAFFGGELFPAAYLPELYV